MVGTTARSIRLFARRTLDALASEVKAEAVVGVLVPVRGLFTRHTLVADATEVKAEAPAVRVVPRMRRSFARTSLRRSRFSLLGGVGTAQVVSKAREETRKNDERAVGEERKTSLA